MEYIKSKIIKLIAIYARVSTSRQENEETIKNQIEALEKYAEENGYKVVQRYLDDGWSGDTLVRPQLDNLRQDAKDKNRQWEGVLVYDPDRLARRYSYQELVADELKEADVEVMYVTTSAPKNPEDKILHGVKGLFAEYERMKIAERFRLGKLRKVRGGNLLVSEALYGYKYIPKDDKVDGFYEVNKEEAEIVKLIFSWVANEKMTLRAVVRRLKKLDIKPRRSKKGVWNTSTLSTMLRNEAYIGKAHWGSSYAVVPTNPTTDKKYKKVKKTSRRTKPKEEWITNEIPVPVIIDQQTFNKARKQLDANFVLCERNKKNDYLLSGKIYCVCGRKRAGEGALKGKHLYYRCTDRVYSFPLPRTCIEGGINARISDNLLWSGLSELMTSPKLLLKQIERWQSGRVGKSKNNMVDVSSLQSKLEKLKVQEERYNKGYGAGVFTLEQLREYVAPVREEIDAVNNQINSAKQKIEETEAQEFPSYDAIKMFVNKVRKNILGLSFFQKRDIVLSMVDKIVASQANLLITGYIPVNQNVAYKTIHRNCRFAKRG